MVLTSKGLRNIHKQELQTSFLLWNEPFSVAPKPKAIEKKYVWITVKSKDLKHVHHGSPKLNYIPFIIMRAKWGKKIKKKKKLKNSKLFIIQKLISQTLTSRKTKPRREISTNIENARQRVKAVTVRWWGNYLWNQRLDLLSRLSFALSLSIPPRHLSLFHLGSGQLNPLNNLQWNLGVL